MATHFGSSMPLVSQPLAHLRRGRTGDGEPGQIAFDVGEKDRDAKAGEILGQHLQRDGPARAGGAGDQP